jgi:hypothetical protein
MINQQARAIMGILKTTPIEPLIKEAALYPVEALLDRHQREYILRLLGLPTGHPAQTILPVSFCMEDCYAQPGEQPIDDLVWAEGSKTRSPWNLGQHLAAKMASILRINPSTGFEEVVETLPKVFPGTILVPAEEEALRQAMAPYKGLILWSDGSRLENRRTGAGIAWVEPSGTWKTKQIPLGQGKEVFDAELVGACKALEIAE